MNGRTKYFVMVRHPAGYPAAIVTGDDMIEPPTRLFESEGDADAAMSDFPAAVAWGYDVYPWEP
jgi:hypothetical protein